MSLHILSGKHPEGVIVHLDNNVSLEDQADKALMVNRSNQFLHEGNFAVEHLEHAPEIFQLIEGRRQYTGYLLVHDDSEHYRIVKKTVRGQIKGLFVK